MAVTKSWLHFASTGPRSIERGDFRTSSPRGHGHFGLQRGRAQLSAEIWTTEADTVQELAASTGPRSIERGDAAAIDKNGAYWCGFNGAALN